MPELVEQKINIGNDAYGRPVAMRRRMNYDGKILWSIKSEPINQRDDGERMDGLTDQNVRDMIQALDIVRR